MPSHFCHACRSSVDLDPNSPELRCIQCRSDFVEEIAMQHQPRAPPQQAQGDGGGQAHYHFAAPAGDFNSLVQHFLGLIQQQPAAPGAAPPPQPVFNPAALFGMNPAAGVVPPPGARGAAGPAEGPQPTGFMLGPFHVGMQPAVNAHVELRFEGDGVEDFLEQIASQLGIRPENARRGIPPAHIALLPNSVVTKKHVDDAVQCTTCMDTFTNVGDRVAELNCGHIFHRDCIVPWLQTRRTCPVCRSDIDLSRWEVRDDLELD